MKRLLTISIIVISLLFIGCKSIGNIMSADSNVRKLEIGMNKKQVVDIMGNTYKSFGARDEGGASTEIIGYDTVEENWMYILHFVNGELKSWQREWVGAPYPYNNELNYY